MKKLSTFISLSILSAIILSSCGHGLSITKRRYTKGYYVSSQKKRPTTKNTPASTAEQPLETLKLVSKPTEQINTGEKLQKTNAVTRAAAPGKNQTARRINNSPSVLPDILSSFSIQKPIKTIDKLIDSRKLQAGSDDDGLSLFWIIILIVLILWLLGFISGNFGGIINLLLVIALILLILWLLKVV